MEKNSRESHHPLLCECGKENSASSFGEPPDGPIIERKSTHVCHEARVLSILMLILLFYIAIFLTVNVSRNICHQASGQLLEDFSALGNSLKFEERLEWYPPSFPWNLEPSDELDAAWDDLIYAIDVRVTGDEMNLLGKNTTNRVQVNRGDYLGSIGVYHHLHCLNNLRMIIHWDYYESRWANYTHPEAFGKGHSDHCINILRQAIMCHPNTAITTFEWVDEVNQLDGKEQRLEAASTCAIWGSIDGWARQRALIPGEFTYRPEPFAASRPQLRNTN
ncbi:hypothetical protein F5Y00DRAFT_260365 [Daldinia vernicosa]|uniref:uncharacterized protein n=1 Tax=Daldinia vernicosa TaxID=114800 RepID=UPI0020081A26|nr:uncharacterized protein F5Y00DRAFT_260365 [Daldinia vernicosa]KAI0850492.1 hypothetical protein F5Y00DRAFT_260365 [Daldinia vernicosa]